MKCIFGLCHKTLHFVKAIHFAVVILSARQPPCGLGALKGSSGKGSQEMGISAVSGGDGWLTGPDVAFVILKLKKERIWGRTNRLGASLATGIKEARPKEASLVEDDSV